MVLGIEGDDFRLLDDEGEPVLYDPECFEVVDPVEPAFWKSVLGDEGERYAGCHWRSQCSSRASLAAKNCQQRVYEDRNPEKARHAW